VGLVARGGLLAGRREAAGGGPWSGASRASVGDPTRSAEIRGWSEPIQRTCRMPPTGRERRVPAPSTGPTPAAALRHGTTGGRASPEIALLPRTLLGLNFSAAEATEAEGKDYAHDVTRSLIATRRRRCDINYCSPLVKHGASSNVA